MADYINQIDTARQQGYSDDEIINYLSGIDSKVNTAIQQGYNPSEIIEYIQTSAPQQSQTPSTVEAPSGADTATPLDEMQRIRQEAKAETIDQDYGFFQALGGAFTKGLSDVGRGFGLTEQSGLVKPVDQEQYEAMRQAQPTATTIGEVAGETIPFLAPGMGVGRIPSLAGRIAGGTVLGATQGGVLAKGEGESATEGALVGGAIGGGAEILFPIIGRLGGRLITKIKGTAPKSAILDINGNPSPELQEVLDKAGVTFDDIKEDALEIMQSERAGLKPEQVAREKFLQSEGLTPTRAQVTREASDFQAQQEAFKTSGRVREALEQQERILTTRFDDAIRNTLGQSESPTVPVIDKVVEKASTLDRQITDLYNQAREILPSEPVVNVSNTVDLIKSNRGKDTLSGGVIQGAIGELKKIGVLNNKGEVVENMTVEQAEEFRKVLNSFYDPAKPVNPSLIREIKSSIDDDVFSQAGNDYFKQARTAKADFEKELERAKISKFDKRKQNLVRDLLENKIDPDEFTNKVVFGKSWRDEDLQQLKDYVGTGSEWNDLKADVLQKIKEKSFIGPEDAQGNKALSRDKLQRAIQSIGSKKLNVIFNKDEVNFLNRLLVISKLREPVRGTALGKGPSAQAIASLESKLKQLPLLGTLIDVINIDATGRLALKAKPQRIEQTAKQKVISRSIPSSISASVIANTQQSEAE